MNPAAIRRRGFTLIELLTVMGIVSVMAVGSVPLLRYVVQGQPVDQAASRLSSLIEGARTYAAARQLYVWLALHQDGNAGTWVATVSTGKTAAYAAGDLTVLQKPAYLKGIVLASGAALPPVTFLGAPPATADEVPVTSADGGFASLPPLSAGGQPLTFERFILFSPSGEATIRSDTVSRWIQLGLASPRGAPKDGALLQICGLTSQCVLYRP